MYNLKDFQPLFFPSSTVKRRPFTLGNVRINRRFGHLATVDQKRLDRALRLWLEL